MGGRKSDPDVVTRLAGMLRLLKEGRVPLINGSPPPFIWHDSKQMAERKEKPNYLSAVPLSTGPFVVFPFHSRGGSFCRQHHSSHVFIYLFVPFLRDPAACANRVNGLRLGAGAESNGAAAFFAENQQQIVFKKKKKKLLEKTTARSWEPSESWLIFWWRSSSMLI
ncbi:hypothetical protein CDAR_386441 [Caerostris darwini]|uniref:Uncharacterized protein n=1 Tax=Caerostris darwini TaxID=1538125 RepID=A0AAV4QHI8_9ARAC|nr:hypothetical protein CDAR_386441 [Caerostris darwini]